MEKTKLSVEVGEMVYYYDDNDHVRRGTISNVKKDDSVMIKDSFNGEEIRVANDKVKPLSKNQKKFVEDARAQGRKIDWDYSGRFMYGARCPSVRTDGPADFNTEASYAWDQMGLGYVVYARS